MDVKALFIYYLILRNILLVFKLLLILKNRVAIPLRRYMASKITSLISTHYLFYLRLRCSSLHPHHNQSPQLQAHTPGAGITVPFCRRKQGPKEILALLVQVRLTARAKMPQRTEKEKRSKEAYTLPLVRRKQTRRKQGVSLALWLSSGIY